MKTKKELNALSSAIGKAIREYHNAVEENLKESGKEHNVVGDDEDVDGLRLSVRGDDNDLNDQVVDKVRWNNEKEYVEYHLIEYNYDDCDDWYPMYWLGEEIDYVYDNIDWE